jgi:chromosome segregation ATPase
MKKPFSFDLQYFAEEGVVENETPEENTDTEDESIDPLEGLSEEATQAINDLQEALNAETAKVTELTAQVEELNNKYNTVVEKLTAVLVDLGIIAQEQETETSESKEDIQALKDQVEGLQAENLALKNENDSLTAQLVELKKDSFADLVEQILAKKVELGDISEENKESERAKLISRSEASLKDALEDLSRRKPVTPRVIEKIVNPAQVDNSESNVVTVEVIKEQKNVATELSPNEVLKGLLTGKKKLK